MSAVKRRSRVLIVWSLLLLALAGIGVYEYLANSRLTARLDGHADTQTGPRSLLPLPLEKIGAIEIAHAQQIHRFERNEQNSTWFYHNHDHTGQQAHQHSPTQPMPTHQADAASAESIGKALAVLGRARIERQFQLDANVSDYGVVKPDMLIMVYKRGEVSPLARYAVGDVAPDGVSRYLLLVGSFNVITIPDYHIDNLLSLVDTVKG